MQKGKGQITSSASQEAAGRLIGTRGGCVGWLITGRLRGCLQGLQGLQGLGWAGNSQSQNEQVSLQLGPGVEMKTPVLI